MKYFVLISKIMVYLFSTTAITNYHKLGGLKSNRILLRFWKLAVQNPCISRICSFWRSWGKICPIPHSKCLVVAGNPWYFLASKCIILLSASVLHAVLPCASVSPRGLTCVPGVSKYPSSYKNTSHWIRFYPDPW